jgi:Tol biopolymer transport system component
MFRHFRTSQTQMTWFSRDGKPLGVVGEAGTLGRPQISPDQRTVAFSRFRDGNWDVWLLDLARNVPTRFTFEPGPDVNPAWSADGRRLFYGSPRRAEGVVVERPANGIGEERIIAKTQDARFGVSKDGRWLFLSGRGGQTSLSLLSVVDGKSIPVTETAAAIGGGVSPDGRWLLYTLNIAGREEVFVRTLPTEAGGPASAGRQQVSSSGGSQPTWRADGKEIFYLSAEGALMAVPFESGESSFRLDPSQELFRTEATSFDVTADGQRFLVTQPLADSSDTPVTVIVNWPQLLKK